MSERERRSGVILCDGDVEKALAERKNGETIRCACSLVAGKDFTSTSKYLATLLAQQERLSKEIAALKREMTKHDQLTGALSIVYFLKAVHQVLAREKSDTPLALVIIDIDNLKYVNDTYGHPAGNTILSRFGESVQEMMRSGDLFGRLGGDEFCIVIEDTRVLVVKDIIERIRAHYEGLEFDFNKNEVNPVHPSFSYGVAILGVDGTVYEELFAAADARMYEEKRARKNKTLGLVKKRSSA